VGIILQRLKEYHREFQDERVATAIQKATDWMIWSNYVYMTCPDHQPGAGYYHHLDGLSYSWELSQKRYYLDEAVRIFAGAINGMAPDHAAGTMPSGSSVEAVANMLRIVENEGAFAWEDGKPVVDPETAPTIEAMRKDPKFKAKAQRRF